MFDSYFDEKKHTLVTYMVIFLTYIFDFFYCFIDFKMDDQKDQHAPVGLLVNS